jgi:mannose/cellobiose epimerase-like protein (N-acyl-D-glucosamine 2-epimerase family)
MPAPMTLFDPNDLATLRPWLLGHVCPFWLKRLRAGDHGFFENLDGNGEPVQDTRRTTLVQARLTYVFSHAYVLSGEDAFRAAAEQGFQCLARLLRGEDGGWLRAVSTDGNVLDGTHDAYDHAFVLFALAWLYRATNDIDPIELADATWNVMQRNLSDRQYGGFQEQYAPDQTDLKLPRRQNPHMHLLEAVLALHAATGEKNWLRRAGMLVDLFKTRFVDPATGALIEFFGPDWSPAPGAEGRLREPGHQFEWVWLLFEYCRATGDASVIPYAERLFAFGTAHGIERDGATQGAVFDGVDAAGGLVAGTKLLWPQTEYIKACVARAEFLGDAQARGAIATHLALIARHFMRADGANWHNQLSRDGTPLGGATPARVLYHLFMAAAETDRLPAVTSQPAPSGNS